MSILAHALAFVLVADPATTEAGRCTRGDHACQAAMYTARAESATTPAARAKYHEAAHRSFLALYDQTRDHEALCAARRSLERTATVLGPETAAQQLAPLRQRLAEREATARPNCAAARSSQARTEKTLARRGPRSRPANDSPTQPASAAPHPVTPAPALASHEPAAVTPATTAEPAILLAVPVRRAVSRSTLHSAAPADPTARRLLIAGGLTIGVGVGLAAVAGYAGARVAHASRESFDLYADNHGQGDAAALAQEEALRHTHARWLPVAVTTAALSGTTVIVGAVLVAIGKRRAAAISSRAALLPIPGGLAIRARF
jgi:hypothetical protein